MSEKPLFPEVLEVLNEYEQRFGDEFPFDYICSGYPNKDIPLIKKYIEEGKPVPLSEYEHLLECDM